MVIISKYKTHYRHLTPESGLRRFYFQEYNINIFFAIITISVIYVWPSRHSYVRTPGTGSDIRNICVLFDVNIPLYAGNIGVQWVNELPRLWNQYHMLAVLSMAQCS